MVGVEREGSGRYRAEEVVVGIEQRRWWSSWNIFLKREETVKQDWGTEEIVVFYTYIYIRKRISMDVYKVSYQKVINCSTRWLRIQGSSGAHNRMSSCRTWQHPVTCLVCQKYGSLVTGKYTSLEILSCAVSRREEYTGKER